MQVADTCPESEANHSLLEASGPSSEAANASESHVSSSETELAASP